MAKISIACPVDGCPKRLEFTTEEAELYGFVDERDHGCMTLTIVGDQGAVEAHMRTHVTPVKS